MSMDPRRTIPLILGIVALVGVGLLLLWDAFPNSFPATSHNFLAAFPLALIACGWLIHEVMRRPGRAQIFKAGLLASAFLFWAANQLWPTLRQATLFNDIAIALFVFDIFLAMKSGSTSWAIRRTSGLAKAADE